MRAVILAKILGLEGQVIKSVVFDIERRRVRVICGRDRRHLLVDCRTGRRGQLKRLLHRTVRDVPLGGWPCEVEIEYVETTRWRRSTLTPYPPVARNHVLPKNPKKGPPDCAGGRMSLVEREQRR